jgi:hypothetical protein
MTDDAERVEELEQQVAELEATVRGLTEELVDRTERIRQLEAEHDLGTSGDDDGGERADADEAKGTEAESGDDTETSESGDDIIVA